MANQKEREPVDRRSAICVVGAGSSGLATGKNLREYGFDVDIIEREDEVGGNWNFGKENSRVYESTHTISSKPFTQYPDFPMPDAFPDYPHHSEILEYLIHYKQHFGLAELIEYDTEVVGVEPRDEGLFWDVTLRLPDGSEETRRYGGLVIANGHNWYPKIPNFPGEFDGEVLHSADYKSPEVFEGKRVLVVGAGNTGCDVAVEAGQHAEICYHSTRRAYWYSPKYVMGKPSDQIFDMLLAAPIPHRVVQFLLEKASRLTSGDIERIGLPEPDHHFLETHPIVNSLLLYYIGHGEIVPKPNVERFEGKTVHFEDGSSVEVDVVVYCTGYLIRFPFIDHDHLNWHNGRPQLYMHVFHPTYDNLAVIGLIQPDSGQFKLVHWQSVALAKLMRLRRENPAAVRPFLRHFRKHCDEVLGAGVKYKESTRHYVEIQHMSYLEELAELIERLDAARPQLSRLEY
ncbi:monooxygenase [Persicimonas caeni]|uniref:4-hydroxybenzoate brominase (decarboxylating) n=1 Tax=Persicimonas caeni TaxID=2292766 RepID=A0A4Y6PZC0_PERCE|nr:NAD(P)-binding domain-containing protein [Persicimonas caeni]QDG53668.1 monooxygenase [Persicimonas caeni]QED34889.1 monooxygenase [Persicimonas caeni]